ncbi:MAG: sugar kinase [Nitratireductor sp.]|nr:sugar kinase [Nitratireductor sp.]
MRDKTFLAIGECMIEFSKKSDGNWRQGFAGDTFNCAWHFRAEADAALWTTSYFTRLGEDAFSSQMMRFIAGQGIATNWITRDSHRQPGLYLIDTRDGERFFTYWRERSAARHLANDEAHLCAAASSAALIFFSGITLAILTPDRRTALLDALARARRNGVQIAFDPNIREHLWESRETMRESVMKAAEASDIILPSFEDEQRIFGDQNPEACIRRYLGTGAGEVTVKNGGDIIHAASQDKTCVVADLRKVTPLDTTGAGDAFNGVYLAARSAGRDLEAAIRQAHEAASSVVLHPGALKPDQGPAV